MTACTTVPTNVSSSNENEEKKGLPTWAWWAIGLAVVYASMDTSDKCIMAFHSDGTLDPDGCDDF